MKITSMEEYGLRCIVQLAMHADEGPVAVAAVAEAEGLSTEYAGKLLNMLRQAGLVESIRGRNGGFVLAHAPDEITVATVMRVFSPELYDDEYCTRHAGNESSCVHTAACSVRQVWSTLSELIGRTLESITLTDLMCGEAELQRELQPQLDARDGPRLSQNNLIQIGDST